MKTTDQIKAKIIELARRASGTNRRQLRDQYSSRDPESRAAVGPLVEQMLASGELLEYLLPKQNGPAERRLFVNRGAGQDWAVGRIQPQQYEKEHRIRKRESEAKTAGPASNPNGIKPQKCPSGVDYRYTVKRLPNGYVSQIDASQSRGWAKAVAP